MLAAAVAGRRVLFLVKLIRSGRPAPGRTDNMALRLREQAIEVFGQKRLIRWTFPGFAHFLTFWGFVVLGLTIVEAPGALLLNQDFAIGSSAGPAGSASSRTFSPSRSCSDRDLRAVRLKNAPARENPPAASTARTPAPPG